MALKELDVSKYGKMSNAELDTKLAELDQIARRPKEGVGVGSRAWHITKGIAMGVIGLIAGSIIEKKLKTNIKNPGRIGGWLIENTRNIGGIVGVAGSVSYMRGNRAAEVNDGVELERAKIMAVKRDREKALQYNSGITADDMQRMNTAMASGQAAGRMSGNVLAERGGVQVRGA